SFFAFDLLISDGKDLRTERLLDRKQELRRLLARSPDSLLKYTEYIDGCGMALFQRVCELDLEGIVAKQKSAPYVTEREHSTWFKILNREYSQKTAEKNCSNVSGTANLSLVGTLAFSLVKHSVSSSCSDLHICLLPLLLHSPISTRLDCSAGLFSFRYGRNKLSYCPISSLLLKIRFCHKSV